jgi:hypothetical protein
MLPLAMSLGLDAAEPKPVPQLAVQSAAAWRRTLATGVWCLYCPPQEMHHVLPAAAQQLQSTGAASGHMSAIPLWRRYRWCGSAAALLGL